MQHIAILGRQPELSLAELESVFGNVTQLSNSTALVEADTIDIERLGGSVKTGRVIASFKPENWREITGKCVRLAEKKWPTLERKLTLGISTYDFPESFTSRDAHGIGLAIKRSLKSHGSVRLVPNTEPVLSSATSHHNKLGLSPYKVELLIVQAHNRQVYVAESAGTQNITALARRDQGRPKRDAFVGMLPPKLALLMINLAKPSPDARILDPFCGTGVVLQEAMLLGHTVQGTDLSQKMIDYSEVNLEWLKTTHHLESSFDLHQGDAIETRWDQPIDSVVAETYLGQPFNVPPSPEKLASVRRNCDEIIAKFLINLSRQIKKGTRICIAVPAWRDANGTLSHLPLVEKIGTFGFQRVEFVSLKRHDLVYFRENQVVTRELIVLIKK